MKSFATWPEDYPPSPGRLLRSRLGRRLFGLFIACALVPVCAVGLLSFKRVTHQLTLRGQERLEALARAAGKTIRSRLIVFESDLRREAPGLVRCGSARGWRSNEGCGDLLLYAAEDILVHTQGTTLRLAGQAEPAESLSPALLVTVAPGRSALAVSNRGGDSRFYMVHRAGTGAKRRGADALVIARIRNDYLWNPADEKDLPGRTELALLDPQQGRLAGHAPDSAKGLTASWMMSQTESLQLPSWRVVMTEPRADVFAPLAGFVRTFPIVLGLALLGVVVLGVIQIRRNLVPLVELVQGTRRVAKGDLHTPVRVAGNDELAALGGEFNAMVARLDHQIRALETAAEIDRAILSSVDTAAIAQTVLDRVPEVIPCEAASLTVIGAEGEGAATTWMAPDTANGGTTRTAAMVRLAPDELLQTNLHPEWLALGEESPVPGYLAHLVGDGAGGGVPALVACPLHQAGELLGVLALRAAPDRRSNERLLDLRRLADRVAVALANARMMDQVRVLAFYDALTRLPNRILYRERLGQAIGRANGQRIGVCSLDLDHFGRINDTLGHGPGDRLIQEVATRLVAVCRQETASTPSPTAAEAVGIQLARLGGDEFAVVLPGLGTAEEALWAARRLLAAFEQPFRLGSQEVFVTGSIGIAMYPEDGGDTETLHKNADVALSHAKDEGRNTIELYSASMNSQSIERMRLEQELRKAVDHGEFTLWYQPIVDLGSRWATGAEALIRWDHPERGLVLPADFIRLCEESGLIVPLGEWSFRSVCAQARRWADLGFVGLRFSVNLSARQLRQRGIVRTVQDILDETGARPSDLTIELTESLLMERGGTTERRIRELAELGISLAIDDFGTGYSSLSYLKHFPVSTLKIDRSFIVDVTTSPDAAAITTAIIALARAMDLDVVAEGVETRAQAAFLRERGCQKGQGYFLGRPAPVELFTDYLRARQRRKASA